MDQLKIKKKVIHVWPLDLESCYGDINYFNTLLSFDEKIKAEKFYFEKDRNCFIISRGVLRVLLSKYLNILNDHIKFVYNRYGKPHVPNDINLNFNVSHSSGKTIIVFVLDSQIGVDIEKITLNSDHLKLAKRFFSANEYRKLKLCKMRERSNSFFHCWARKEAFIKAHGEGLGLPLDFFEVSFLEEEEPKLLQVNWENEDVANWEIVKLSVHSSFASAIAIKGKYSLIKIFHWKNKANYNVYHNKVIRASTKKTTEQARISYSAKVWEN